MKLAPREKSTETGCREQSRSPGPLHQFHIMYVSVNAIAAGRRARTRDAIASVRHLFLEADHDGDRVLSAVCVRPDLPAPNRVSLRLATKGCGSVVILGQSQIGKSRG
jgi:hypothetical protein